MYEKVNPAHPDKVADRIAGAIVDLAYAKEENPKIAVEVLLGHAQCKIIVETSSDISSEEIDTIVKRLAGDVTSYPLVVAQNSHLSKNQNEEIKCGDNGIFKGLPITSEESYLTEIAQKLYSQIPYDGKYVYDETTDNLIICQSNATEKQLKELVGREAIINPLGEWTGGISVDTGAVNRKLGSDMAFAVTGGGLHGKDLSKADVTLNIYAHLEAQRLGREVHIFCAIGDTEISGKPYSEIVEIARGYIKELGGFEKFAEWGLIR